jgi:hypothetical protein
MELGNSCTHKLVHTKTSADVIVNAMLLVLVIVEDLVRVMATIANNLLTLAATELRN